MINRLAVFIVLFFAIAGCSKSKLFYEKGVDNTLVCDTIYDKSLRNGYITLSIYQKALGATIELMDETYFEFSLSTTSESSPLVLLSKNEIIYFTSKEALTKNDYRLEKFIDFNAKKGDSWNLTQGGLLGNSRYTLDSISTSNDLYYLSIQRIIEVDDAIFPYQMVLSKKDGIKEIGFNVQGHSTRCKCN
jgi:hypothetical protein